MPLLTCKSNYNGYMKFIFIANRFCLDLVNTVVTLNGKETDLLIGPSQVQAWLDLQGLSLTERISEPDLEQLKELRALIRQWVTLKPQSVTRDLNRLNTYLEAGQFTKKLIVEEGGVFSFETSDHSLSPKSLLTKVANDFANLLVTDKLSQIKLCSGEACVLVFLDVSKSKRRRWCSMKACGNRAKASAFYQNRKVQ